MLRRGADKPRAELDVLKATTTNQIRNSVPSKTIPALIAGLPLAFDCRRTGRRRSKSGMSRNHRIVGSGFLGQLC